MSNPSRDTKPKPRYAIGARVQVLDAGTGVVEGYEEPQEAGQTYGGLSWTPYRYHVRLERSGELRTRGETMLAPAPPAPEPSAPPITPEELRRQRRRNLETCIQHADAAFEKRSFGEDASVPEMVLQSTMTRLTPQDHAALLELLRAHESLLAHLVVLDRG